MLAKSNSLNPFRLAVTNPAGLRSDLVQRLVDCWNHSYQRMASRFNSQAPTQVHLEVVSALQHPGVTLGSLVRISADWLRAHPEDFDVMTHEQFHVVQNYGPGAQPGWAIEGLADYARWKYGLSNRGWSLPEFRPDHHWSQGYRVTAAFFGWLEERLCPGFPEELDKVLRLRAYSSAFWPGRFGKPLQQLWSDFGLERS